MTMTLPDWASRGERGGPRVPTLRACQSFPLADRRGPLAARGGVVESLSAWAAGANAANNWNFSAAAVCFQELAVVPLGGDWLGNTVNQCVNGNVLNPS